MIDHPTETSTFQEWCDAYSSLEDVAIALIKDKMFRVTPRGKKVTLKYIQPDRLAMFINCPSGDVLRRWLRKQYPDHVKNTPWYIDPPTALDIVKHYGLY